MWRNYRDRITGGLKAIYYNFSPSTYGFFAGVTSFPMGEGFSKGDYISGTILGVANATFIVLGTFRETGLERQLQKLTKENKKLKERNHSQ